MKRFYFLFPQELVAERNGFCCYMAFWVPMLWHRLNAPSEAKNPAALLNAPDYKRIIVRLPKFTMASATVLFGYQNCKICKSGLPAASLHQSLSATDRISVTAPYLAEGSQNHFVARQIRQFWSHLSTLFCKTTGGILNRC